MKLIGYGCYSRMPESIREVYEPMKKASQEKLFKDLYGGGEGSEGSKYKTMYEDAQKNLNVAMRALKDSGMKDEELMEMFGIKSKKTLQNRLGRARKV